MEVDFLSKTPKRKGQQNDAKISAPTIVICSLSTQLSADAKLGVCYQSGKKRKDCKRSRFQKIPKDFPESAKTKHPTDTDEMPAAKRFKWSIAHPSTVSLQPKSTFSSMLSGSTERLISSNICTPPRPRAEMSYHSEEVDRCQVHTPRASIHVLQSPDISSESPEDSSKRTCKSSDSHISVERHATPPRSFCRTYDTLTDFSEERVTPRRLTRLSAKVFPAALTSSHDANGTPRLATTNKQSRRNVASGQTPIKNGVSTPRANISTPREPVSPRTPQAPRRVSGAYHQSWVQAILSGNIPKIDEALMNGEDPNAQISVPILEDETNYSMGYGHRQKLLPLLAAAKLSTAATIEKLLQAGAVSNSVNSSGQTALHLVCLQRVLKLPQPMQPSDEPPASFCSNLVPESWLKLKEFFNTVGIEEAHKSERNLKSFNSCNDSENGTPRWTAKTLSLDRKIVKPSPEFDNFQESELVRKAETLLKYGTDLNLKDLHGKTAADYAKQNGLTKLYGLLTDNKSLYGLLTDNKSCPTYKRQNCFQTGPLKGEKNRARVSQCETYRPSLSPLRTDSLSKTGKEKKQNVDRSSSNPKRGIIEPLPINEVDPSGRSKKKNRPSLQVPKIP